MKQKIIISLLLLATLLAGCSKDPFDMGLPDNPLMVSFGVTIIDTYPQLQVKTRGTPQVGITAYEDKKITVMAFDQTSAVGAKKDFTITLSKNDDQWVTNPTKWYDGLTYNFYAYASDLSDDSGISVSVVEGKPIITYTVPDDVTKQPDLIISDKVEGKSTGKVSLSMYHALSCVGFVASSKHVGNVRKVRSVVVKNIYGEGSASLNKSSDAPISWTTIGDPDVTFSAGMNEEPLSEKFEDIANKLTYLMQGNGYLMMVPQTLPEGAQVVMEIWDGTNLSSIHTITYDIPPTTWESGKKYIYYFDEPILDGVATYYERYSDGGYGFYYYDGKNAISPNRINPIREADTNPVIVDAGYGLLVPASTYTQYPAIYLGISTAGDAPKDLSTSDGSIVTQLSAFTGSPLDCVLYPLSQDLYPYNRNGNVFKGFRPYYTDTPVMIEAGVSETGTGKPINTQGYFLPHYAKGVYTTATPPSSYIIRTPIQMRNISYQTGGDTGAGVTVKKTYIQELGTLDFSIHSDRTVYGNDVGGAISFKESIVIGGFGGTFDGGQSYGGTAKISGLIISTPNNHLYNTSLFEWVTNSGEIKNIETMASCIYIANQTTKELFIAGVAATNSGKITDAVNRASITNNSVSNIHIAGVVGLNSKLIQSCKNYGVVNNKSSDYKSRTAGVVAFNEKYTTWNSLGTDDKEAFRNLQYNDFNSKLINTHPGAVIYNSENSARIVGSGRVGGIAAYNNYGGVVYQCTNTGEIRNNGACVEWIMLGGIVGHQQCGEENNNPADSPQFFSAIQECINKGNVTAISGVFGNQNLSVGGIIGNNDFAPAGIGQIAAYGIVSCSVVDGATISGYFSDTGGIAGLNSGNVKRSLCTQVNIGGIFGQAIDKKRNSAGGIVGTNNNYVSSCLFVHSSLTTPISGTPIWYGSSSSGGIVGINNTNSTDSKSSSGYVQKCVFSAQAPLNIPIGTEIGTFAPIAGYSGGYLFRTPDGKPHLKSDGVDGTTGATPLYTLDDNYYGSGTEINYTNQNISFPNEPIADSVRVGPFIAGRYPYGQTRFQKSGESLIPVNGWFKINDFDAWIIGSRPPIPSGLPGGYDKIGYKLPEGGGTLYILEALVAAIQDKQNSTGGEVLFDPVELKVASMVRVSLNYMSEGDLSRVTAINCNLSKVTFLSNGAGGEGSLFFRAPSGWKFAPSQTNPKPYKMTVVNSKGAEAYHYWYCLVTSSTGTAVTMVRE